MTALLTRLLGRIPIGWLQLTHSRARLFSALAGVMFANILVFVQLGIMGSFSESVRLAYSAIEADIIISSNDSNTLTDGSNIPRQWMYQALSVKGVEEAMPLYLASISWTQPGGLDIMFQTLGVNPVQKGFLGEGIGDMSGLNLADTILVDRSARGLPPEQLAEVSPDNPIMIEAMGRQLRVIGTVSIGGGFSGDGYAVTSDQTFFRLFPSRSAGAPDHILIRLVPGADAAIVIAELKAVLPEGSLKIRSLATAIEDDVIYQTTKRPTGLIFGFGVVIGILVGIVIVYQVLSTDVADHIKEYATFKAMGYGQSFLLSVIFEEAVILALLGFIPGFAVSAVLLEALNALTSLPMGMDAGLALMVLAGTVLSCAVSGAIATRKLANADPADLF